ncbi:gll2374 [Gloeobacter violaceus PCC 7421]|uniref:Gll2374 protein n=1 Tax=Gloeobacter violaceus (strain ATCC 29082 / PCC 7421) TaxID=251221 RepID=Q7NI10_GLOVI|nr:gll2374 [Gloeobacter violaceus PCC 7421]
MPIWMSLKSQHYSWNFPAIALPSFPPARAWRQLLALCSLLLVTCSAPGYVDTVLFLVTQDREHGGVTIEPVVKIEKGHFYEPTGDTKFMERHTAERVLPLYRQGQLVGRVQATGAAEYSCYPAQYSARLQLSVPAGPETFSAQGLTYWLASTALLLDSPQPAAALTAQERALLERTARERLGQLGLTPSYLQAAQLTDAARISVAGKPALVGTVSALADSVGRAGATAFVLLESVDEGWQVVYAEQKRFSDIYGQDFIGQVFRDTIDLDRDGTPELIVEQTANEVYRYQILKRREGTWEVIYTGGGGGC